MRWLRTTATGIWRSTARLGRVVCVIGALAWLGAVLSGWEELAVIATACLIAMAIAILFTLGRNDYEIDLDLQPRRVVVGERAGGEMIVRNVAGRRSLPVRVELTIGRGAASFRIPSLADGAEHDELFSVPTNRRAIIPVGPASTVRGDPLGLLRRQHQWSTSTDLYVHPKISNLDRLGAGFLRDLEGQTTQDLSPSDVAFHTLREYVPGDDRRHVHWKTTARVGKLMVRQFVDTRRSFLSVIVSTDPADYANPDEFELAISMAASIGVRALHDDQTVSFVAGGKVVPSASPVSLLDSTSGFELIGDRLGTLADGVTVANRVASDASIVALALGSAVTLADARAAASRLSADARVLVFRADPDGDSAYRTIGETTIVNAPDLDEYSRVLFQVSNS